MKKCIKNKRQRGVTLVALVITIILLLILAGITISALSGDNGILKNATNAKDETEIAQGKEQLTTIYLEESLDNLGGNIEIDEYLDYLENKGIPTREENSKSYAEVDGKIYEVAINNGNLSVEYVEDGEITEPRIKEIDIVNKTLNSITIKVTAIRMEGGTYTYYIGTDKENLGEAKGENQTGEFTFEDLNQGETYYIKVVGENQEGQTAEKTM